MVSHSLLLALIIRSCSLLLPHTFFQPDEFYQAFEPAHKLVFGYGFLTWEWRDLPSTGFDWWSTHVAGGRMRSWLWPSTFALVYKALQAVRLDQTFLLVRPFGRQSDMGLQLMKDTRTSFSRSLDRCWHGLCYISPRQQTARTWSSSWGCELIRPSLQVIVAEHPSSSYPLPPCSMPISCRERSPPHPRRCLLLLLLYTSPFPL